MKIGIVGLPNVGKSTLFNALTKTQAAKAENFPFCTIDPNVGIVEVPDERIQKLQELVNPTTTIPATVEFVDIAGLVQGASKGEGLGNQFLSHIRECHAIAQVIRIFEDSNTTHVHDSVDPKRDIEIIETELILADVQTLEKRLIKAKNDAKSGDKEKKAYLELLERVEQGLAQGHKVIDLNFSTEEQEALKDLHFLTAKPLLYIANVNEDELSNINNPEAVANLKKNLGLAESTRLVPISAKIEAELGALSSEEATAFLQDLGLQQPGLHALIKAAYDVLGLHTYFTAGPKEVHAWTIPKGATAPQAAGIIHTDFEQGFIRAEVISCPDFIKCGGEAAARTAGLMRTEGKDYIVKDGDIMHFLFSS